MKLRFLACSECKGDLVVYPSYLQCKSCKNRFSIEGKIPNMIKSLDKHTKKQEHIWSGKTYASDPKNPDLTTIQERFAQRLIRSLKLPEKAIVVDVGCFIGEKLWYLASKKKITGIGTDISIPALQMAKKIDIYGHSFIGADLERLPFKDNSVDAILVFDVIEHLSNPEKGFSEIKRVLKPGGQYLLHIPIKDNKWSFFWWKQQLFPKQAKADYEDVGHTDERMFTSDQIKSFLQKNNLIVQKEIFYNSFLVHFFDREIFKLAGQLFLKATNSHVKSEKFTRPAASPARTFYARKIVPILEIVSLPDWILSTFKIGNTYFVLSKKQV